MNELKNVMEIIDRHSNIIPEGDYLEICNNLRKAYKVKEGHSTLFDYSDTILPNASSVYFEMEFYDRAAELDYDFLSHQMTYLLSEKDAHLPFQRASKTIQNITVRHYCESHGIDLSEYTPNVLKVYLDENNILKEKGFTKFFKDLCRSYLQMENNFREIYRNNINNRIQNLRELSNEI